MVFVRAFPGFIPPSDALSRPRSLLHLPPTPCRKYDFLTTSERVRVRGREREGEIERESETQKHRDSVKAKTDE